MIIEFIHRQFTEIVMTELKIIFILISFILAIGESKHLKCTPIICPQCNIQMNETYHELGLRILNAKGPANCSCGQGDQSYKFFGKDYGLPNDAPCCVNIIPSAPVQCSPRDPAVPDCPYLLGLRQDETFYDYYMRVGKDQKNAPLNGCCPAGSYKYIFASAVTGNTRNTCACVIYNKAYADESSEDYS